MMQPICCYDVLANILTQSFGKWLLEYFFSDIKASGFIICLLLGSASSHHDTNEVHEDETYYTPQLDYKRKYVH